MPTTTAISAVPSDRPSAEAQAAITPVFRLSNAASGDDQNGQSTPQVSALFDADRLLARGLIIGARLFGESGDAGLEPYVGYRRRVGARHAVAVVGYGTKMGAEKDGVTYEALRVGGEVLGDTMLGRFGTWGELHVAGAISATYLSADGTYCVGGTGDGVDCDDAMQVPRVDGDLSGLYTAGTLTLALDIARSSRSAFHLARLGVMVSGGQMPRLVNGEQQRGTAFITGGLGLTLGFGAGR